MTLAVTDDTVNDHHDNDDNQDDQKTGIASSLLNTTFAYFVVGVFCVFGCAFVIAKLPREEELRVPSLCGENEEQVF